MALAAGDVLEDRYRIEHLMGRGGMGAVYRAHDLRLQQTVAIKENAIAGVGLSPDTFDASRRQFEQEALMLARLRHPSLPRVIDHFVTSEGNQYLVMDFITGDDLGQIIARGGPVPQVRAIAWIGQVCDALEYLHSQKPPIIHRDVKPQNIKVTPQGQVLLVDFGLAKAGDLGTQTMAGALNVTPGFSPPEQYNMSGTDVRSDIYALGATLYALLTGHVPPDSISLQSGDKQLVPPRQMNSNISPRVQQAVLKAMSARRDDRPQSAGEFWTLLKFVGAEGRVDTIQLAEPLPEASVAPLSPLRKKRWWLALAGVGIIALIVIALIVTGGLGSNRGPAASPTAIQPTVAVALRTAPLNETTAPATAPPTAKPLIAILNPTRMPEQVDALDLSGKNVTVTFWHERSEHNQALLQAMLDEFSRMNKYGIMARAEIAGTSYSELYSKIGGAIQAGAPPELSMAFQSQAAIYRSTGAVIDLMPFVQSQKYGLSQSELDDFFPAMLESGLNPHYPGERLGWPVQRAMDVLYYNADWLKQLGYNSPPQDWKQLEEIACKAADKSKGKTGWAFRHDATNFATLVLSRGGRILSKDGETYVFNGDAGVDAVKMIQRMFEKGCAVEIPTNEQFGEQIRFANGQVLFVMASSISLPFYADAVGKAAKFKWDIALPPASNQPVVVLSGADLIVHKTTPEKELAAWLVIKFLSEKAQTVRWADETGYLPVRKSAQSDLLAGFRKNKFYSPVVDLFGKLFDWLPSSVTEPPIAGYDAVRGLLDRGVMSKAMADPKADAKTLLEAAVKKANDTLK